MSADRDLSALLPEAPPPRPARRDAAIEAALRRFDGEADAPPAAAPHRRPALWRRPQIGVLIAASLVGVIALPVWLIGDREQVLAPSVPPRIATDQPSAAPGEAAPIAVAAPDAAPVVVTPETAAAIPSAPKTAPLAEIAPEPEQGVAREGLAAPAAPAPPPPPPPSSPAMATRAAAPASKAAADASDHGNIVVTARRRQENAQSSPVAISAFSAESIADDESPCTIDAPGRTLRACRKSLDASAPGAADRGKAKVVDGLRQARRGDIDRAIAEFDRAIAASPDLASAYYNRGLAYRRKGDAARARADLDRAAQLDPRYRGH